MEYILFALVISEVNYMAGSYVMSFVACHSGALCSLMSEQISAEARHCILRQPLQSRRGSFSCLILCFRTRCTRAEVKQSIVNSNHVHTLGNWLPELASIGKHFWHENIH